MAVLPKRETEQYKVRKGYTFDHFGKRHSGGTVLNLTEQEAKSCRQVLEKIVMPKKPITNINNRAILQNVHPVIEKRINEVVGIEVPKPLMVAPVIIDKERLKEINKKKEAEEKLKAEEEEKLRIEEEKEKLRIEEEKEKLRIEEEKEKLKTKEEKKKPKRIRGKK